MAVIGKIQKNSLVLLIFIGAALLLFIFADSFPKLMGSSQEITPVATIYGEEIDNAEYEELKNSYEVRERNSAYQQGKEFTDEMKETAYDNAFNEYVRREIMNTELSKLGIVVFADELNDMVLGNHIHPWIMQEPGFKNAFGIFSKDSVAKYINFLETEPDITDTIYYNAWYQNKLTWKKFENELKINRAADKYVSLLQKGVYINSIEAKNQYESVNEKRQIAFVVKKYTDIENEEVELTDEDLLAYYNEHKNDKQYEQTEESAVIQFVEFPVTYSQADIDEAVEKLEDMKEDFKASQNDIYFMANKSDVEFYSDSNVFKSGQSNFTFVPNNLTYAAVADEAIQAADSGDVIGPFVTPGQVVLAKVKGFENEEQAWVRHILIANSGRTDEQAKAKADSVMKVINENNNFVDMVKAVSEDGGSIANNGEYKWFKKGVMVEPFENASFNGPKNKLQLVKTTYGYHIVEVLDRRNAKLPVLAPVVKTLKPSHETKEMYADLAYEFITEVTDMKDDSAFFNVANRDTLTVNSARLTMNYRYVIGFDDSEEIKKFAFAKDAVEGDISDPIYDGQVYKVAILTNKIDKGVPEFEDIKDQLRFPALRHKQAEKYMEMYGANQTPQELAAKYPELRVMTATLTFNSNTIQGGGGNEPKVVGSVFSVPFTDGQTPLLVPMEGNAGVYVIVLENVTPAPESTDFSIEKTTIERAKIANVSSYAMKALREKADVQDNRAKVNIQGQ